MVRASTPSSQHTSDATYRHAARCPICHALKHHGIEVCTEHEAHLTICGACGQTARVVEGLCGDCTEREAGFPLEAFDVDRPIPFELTARAYAALAATPAPNVASY